MQTNKKIFISLAAYVVTGLYAAYMLGSSSPNGPKNILIAIFGPFAAFSNFDIWSLTVLIAAIVTFGIITALVGAINHPVVYVIFAFLWIYIGYLCYAILAVG